MTIKNKEFYKNRVIKQVVGVLDIFDWFFSKEKFDNIIELGTGTGSFTIFLGECAKKMEASLYTFDIKPINNKIKSELLNIGVKIFTCDIDKTNEIDKILNKKGRCLILNDGGLKVPQFIKYSPKLKNNDILMTHDFYKDREDSASGIIVMNDVRDIIEKNNLKILYKQYFDKYLWLCIKK